MSFSYSPKIITDGLVLYLDAANTRSYVSGSTTWNDLSRGGNSGTLTNGPTFNNGNGGSIVFDGSDDYIITPTGLTPTLNITSQITLESWFKSTSLANIPHGDGLFCKGLSSDNNSGVYEMALTQSGSVNYPFFRIRTTSTLFYNPTNIVINLNQIYHIVCTYNGSIMRIFINGVESGSGLSASGLIQNNTQPLTIGVRYIHTTVGGLDSFFSGNIYLSKIYNLSLSTTEILQNYNTTKTRFGL